MEFITYGGILWIGMIIGWKLRERAAIRQLEQLQLEEIEEYVENKKIPITVEIVDDQWFIYKKEDGSFMAQGESWEEVTDRMAERFPEKRFIIEPENAKAVGLNL